MLPGGCRWSGEAGPAQGAAGRAAVAQVEGGSAQERIIRLRQPASRVKCVSLVLMQSEQR
jgi:hypothetical protein